MAASPAVTFRTAFTLIELLVVVAILGLLSVIVIPNLSGNIEARRYREAARDVSAFMARCQSRAIGAREPKGAMLQPLAANSAVCLDLYFSDTPEIYAGETSTSTAVIAAPSTASAGTLAITFDTATRDRLVSEPTFCRPGDAIQFGGTGAKFKFLPPDRVAMWFEDNQNTRNTSWPRATGAGLPFKIWRQPSRGTGGVLQLQKGAAIDLAWCCLGSRPFRDFMDTSIADNAISILFDASGKPLEIVHPGKAASSGGAAPTAGVRTTVGAPIFLLIGQGDLCGNSYDPAVSRDAAGVRPEDRGGANWQYGDCIWLCIDNNSGVVKMANVSAETSSVILSQRAVRLAIGYGLGGQ
jgi:prepilin-type N-terminal cleavage/methylation domain-containing protein